MISALLSIALSNHYTYPRIDIEQIYIKLIYNSKRMHLEGRAKFHVN